MNNATINVRLCSIRTAKLHWQHMAGAPDEKITCFSYYTEMLQDPKSRFIHLVCATMLTHLQINVQQIFTNPQ